MRPLSRREKWIVAVTGGLVGLLLIYVVGVKSLLDEWRQTRDEITLLETKLKRTLLLSQKKTTLQTEFQTYHGLLRASDPEQMRTKTLSEIEKLTREQALRVIEMRPLTTRRQGLFQEYMVEVDLEGTIGQLIQLVHRLQSSSGLLKVERLQITAKGSQGSLLKAVMTLSRLAKE